MSGRRLLVVAERNLDFVNWCRESGLRSHDHLYLNVHGVADRVRGLSESNTAIVTLAAPSADILDVFYRYKALGMVQLDPTNRRAIHDWLSSGTRPPVPWPTVEAIAAYVRSLDPEYEAVADAILAGFVESKPSKEEKIEMVNDALMRGELLVKEQP